MIFCWSRLIVPRGNTNFCHAPIFKNWTVLTFTIGVQLYHSWVVVTVFKKIKKKKKNFLKIVVNYQVCLKKKKLGPIIFLNPHPHTSPQTWSNSFKPTPFRWVTTYYCLYILLTFCFFFSFFHFLFSLFPLWEETQRRLRRKNRVALHHRFASKITMVNWFLSFFPFIVYYHATVIAQTLI